MLLRYAASRLLLAVPTLLVVSLTIFGLEKCATSDPVRAIRSETQWRQATEAQIEQDYARHAKDLGFDKPDFYFSLTTAAFPDSFSQILMPERRQWLAALTEQTGNWPAVQAFSLEIRKLNHDLESLPDSSAKLGFLAALNDLRNEKQRAEIPAKLDSLAHWAALFQAQTGLQIPLNTLHACGIELATTPPRLARLIPIVRWQGIDNQYHRWITGFFTGNLGKSFETQTPVWDVIRERLARTVGLNVSAILLAYLLALPLGIWAARRAGKPDDLWLRRILTGLYTMPTFWLGGLFILFFATTGIGIHIVSGTGIGSPEDHQLSYFQWFAKYADRLVLPVFVLAMHLFALLALQLRGSILDVIQQNFIRTARAKGLSERAVFARHAFRNALFPLIAIFGSLFPLVFGGSMVIETLFGIPAMGTKVYDAFLARDFPVLFAILMYSAMLTIAGSLLADVLYALADPRVRLGSRK